MMQQQRGMGQGPTMLAGAGPFMQGMPPSGQPQMPPGHMGMPPNTNSGNQAMMNPNMNPQQRQQFLLQQQHASQQQRMAMQQGQQGRPMMNSGGPPGGAGVGGVPQQMGPMGQNPGMGFNPMMPGGAQNAVRRVSSQPNLNQGPGGPMGGVMNMNQRGIPGAIPGNLPGGLPGALPPQLASQALRMQQQNPQHNMAGAMAGMNMGMDRSMGNPGAMSGGPGRPVSTQGPPQLMNSLSQPATFAPQMGPPQNQFPNTPVPQPAQVPSPARVGSHTPSISMSTPGPSHTPANRQSMGPDDAIFMGLGNQQFNRPHMQPTVNGNPFPNIGGPSSSPAIPNSDPQSMPPGMMARGPFPTPAQQFEQMNNNSENFGNNQNHLPMGPPPIPRPPSQHNAPTPHSAPTPQQLHPQVRQSPHPPEGHMNIHPARPQSQPQNQPGPRPPSRQHQTPRSAHPQPQLGGPSQGGRPGTAGGSSTGPMAPGPASGGGPQGPPTMQGPNPGPQLGPRQGPQPAQLNPPAQPNPQAGNVNAAQPNTPATGPPGLDPNSATNPRSPSFDPSRVIGSGQGLMRLLQFSGALASEDPETMKEKTRLKFWEHLMTEYFTPKAQMKFTLWRDSQRLEAKPFNIGVPILSRFFLVTTQSGVKSMNLSLDGARERMYNPGHSMVECVGAIWTYKYHNGYSVTLRGPLTVHVVIHIPGPNDPVTKEPDFKGYVLKFDEFQFDANFYDKYVLSEAIAGQRATIPRPEIPAVMNGQMSQQQREREEEERKWEEPRIGFDAASIPGEPVNAFGIPQATMRCLELAESVSHMEDLISFSSQSKLGPLEALQKYAIRLRETSGGMFPQVPMMNGNGHIPAGNEFNPMHAMSHTLPHTIPTSITLYSSAPPSVTNPQSIQSIGTPSSATANTSSPQNATPSASSSPQKQHKTIPHGTPSLANATSPAVSSGATNTPAMSNASLKRKGGDTTSPNTGNEPATKRQARKRRGTAVGGS